MFIVASLIGLLAAGIALIDLSRTIDRPAVRRLGLAAGSSWTAGALLALLSVPLWATNNGVPLLSAAAFVATTVAAPLLLAAWTLLLAGRSVTGVLAAFGLIAVAARSSLWILNKLLSPEDGFYIASAILTIVALLGFPAWICWLVRMGLQLNRTGVPRLWRRFVAGLVGVAFALGYAIVSIVSAPTPSTDRVPSVPSAGGAAFYVVMLALGEKVAGPSSDEELRNARQSDSHTRPENPPGGTLEKVDTGGVEAEYICADGASRDHAVLYLHGGGYVMPVSNNHRRFSVTISRATRSCVLLPNYRPAPDHPFPAATQDSLVAYRWLLRKGIPGARIAIFGDSCGGTFTLSTALSLRDSNEELPAALVSLSGGFDLTRSGATHRTKAAADPMLNADDTAYSVRSYTDDPRNPLASPLFADLKGLPPTLLLAGSQEVLLSDSTRLADRLRAAGVDTKLEVWPGMTHVWPSALEGIPEADLAIEHIATFISSRTGSPR